MSIPDNQRVDAWQKEFAEYETSGDLPAPLHPPPRATTTRRARSPRYPTPTAMVAENDLALGRLVETITRSRYWKDSAIFVLEDDAQNGPDHVDAHRSVALVVSPYTRRGAVDSTLYTTSGMLRTIELILGLPPMSQYDAAATPDVRRLPGRRRCSPPYTHRPARVPPRREERCLRAGRGGLDGHGLRRAGPRSRTSSSTRSCGRRSAARSSTMPPPVRAAFVRPIDEDEDEEDEDDDRR